MDACRGLWLNISRKENGQRKLLEEPWAASVVTQRFSVFPFFPFFFLFFPLLVLPNCLDFASILFSGYLGPRYSLSIIRYAWEGGHNVNNK